MVLFQHEVCTSTYRSEPPGVSYTLHDYERTLLISELASFSLPLCLQPMATPELRSDRLV